jgi:hypothetical protein
MSRSIAIVRAGVPIEIESRFRDAALGSPRLRARVVLACRRHEG